MRVEELSQALRLTRSLPLQKETTPNGNPNTIAHNSVYIVRVVTGYADVRTDLDYRNH